MPPQNEETFPIVQDELTKQTKGQEKQEILIHDRWVDVTSFAKKFALFCFPFFLSFFLCFTINYLNFIYICICL